VRTAKELLREGKRCVDIHESEVMPSGKEERKGGVS
jgi:hypothetical protein